MNKLLRIITYDHKHLDEPISEEGRQMIIRIASIFNPLEEEIVQHKASMIDFSPKTGALFTVGFPKELGSKMTDLLNGKGVNP